MTSRAIATIGNQPTAYVIQDWSISGAASLNQPPSDIQIKNLNFYRMFGLVGIPAPGGMGIGAPANMLPAGIKTIINATTRNATLIDFLQLSLQFFEHPVPPRLQHCYENYMRIWVTV